MKYKAGALFMPFTVPNGCTAASDKSGFIICAGKSFPPFVNVTVQYKAASETKDSKGRLRTVDGVVVTRGKDGRMTKLGNAAIGYGAHDQIVTAGGVPVQRIHEKVIFPQLVEFRPKKPAVKTQAAPPPEQDDEEVEIQRKIPKDVDTREMRCGQPPRDLISVFVPTKPPPAQYDMDGKTVVTIGGNPVKRNERGQIIEIGPAQIVLDEEDT